MYISCHCVLQVDCVPSSGEEIDAIGYQLHIGCTK
jgi:hypothetical protein